MLGTTKYEVNLKYERSKSRGVCTQQYLFLLDFRGQSFHANHGEVLRFRSEQMDEWMDGCMEETVTKIPHFLAHAINRHARSSSGIQDTKLCFPYISRVMSVWFNLLPLSSIPSRGGQSILF